MQKIIFVDAKLNQAFIDFTMFIATEKQLAKNTIFAYRNDIKCFLYWLKQNPNLSDLQNITIDNLRLWLAFRLEKKITHRSNARAISAMKSFFEYLSENNILHNKAIFNLKKPRLPKLLPKAITNEKVQIFLSALQNCSKEWQGARDIALFTLIFTTGMRISEAISITKKDLKNDIFYVTGKGGKTRIVPIIDIAKQKIEQYLALCPYVIMDEEKIFVSNLGKKYISRIAQQTMQNIRQQFGLGDITPHTLRHSCATALLESSDELQKIQRLLGHESLSTTQIYTKINKEKLMKILDYY